MNYFKKRIGKTPSFSVDAVSSSETNNDETPVVLGGSMNVTVD